CGAKICHRGLPRFHASMLESGALGAEEKKASALASLGASVTKLDSFGQTLKSITGVLGTIKEAIGKFVALTAQIARAVISAVKGIVGVVKGVVGELIGIAQNIMRAGMNIALTIAAIMTLPQQIKAEFQNLASAYTSMMCVLTNIFKKRRFLPDYNINGTGNCASTSGGSGVSSYVSSNTFAAILTEDKSATSVTTAGAEAITYGVNMDPTTETMAGAGNCAGAICGGVTVDSTAVSSYKSKSNNLEYPTADQYAASWPGKDWGAPMPEGWTG
ncbi:hypothetical protein, partial [Propionivibrio sp.]|uniref:hypothetical protein n=1 Tax=Propionivibrio sp. TaxID=2212460 RepID=UPI003BF0B34B